MAWKAGAFIGQLITYGTGNMIEDEEALLRIYIANAEIESAVRNASGNDIATVDILSLYLTSQESGLNKSCNYFYHANYSIVFKLRLLFTGQDYPEPVDFVHALRYQVKKLDNIRKQLGLNSANNPISDDYFNYLAEVWNANPPMDAGDTIIY